MRDAFVCVQTLRIRGEAEGEWGFLYRSTLGSLMSGLTEIMKVWHVLL